MKSIGWGRTGELCLVRSASACMQHSYKFMKEEEKKTKGIKRLFWIPIRNLYLINMHILAEICIVLEWGYICLYKKKESSLYDSTHKQIYYCNSIYNELNGSINLNPSYFNNRLYFNELILSKGRKKHVWNQLYSS